ncbi:hypothetical protein HZ326_30539 [Fusarium oxysporum f. sp. albedinis]|nr:hypothetical protein HZ326_30539 [Fusarium oxysporum f. sp. albedinis]
MGLPLRYSKAEYDWCLDYKQMGSHCKVGNGTRDWTKEEMMSYLDWDRAENDWVEQSVEIEMAEQPFSRRRGMQDIWDAAERDIMLQEKRYTYPHMYTHLCLLHNGSYSHDRWCEGHVILGAPSVVQVWLPYLFYTVLFEIMPRFIPLLLPNQHQGAIPRDAIHRDNMSQRREQCRDPDTNINLDVSVVYSTDAHAARTGTVDSAQPTWLSGMSGNSFSRVSPTLLDPFNPLCESPERLRQLLRYRRARDLPLAKAAGEPLFRIDQQTHSVQFQGLGNEDGQAPLLTHKSLFHALSLLLALAANDYQQNYETMHHRSQVLQSLNQDFSRFGGDSTLLHTITAILMLISYEYRVRDTNPRSDSAATHIHGLQSIISQPNILTSRHSVALVSLIQRALLWQDIICSLATGAPRLLQVDNRGIFTRLREDQMYRSYFVLPQGFLLHTYGWPASASTVFEDLNALCGLVDTMRRRGRASISFVDNDYMGTSVSSMQLMENMDHEGYPLCNSQANLQIRLVDLLSGTRRDGPQSQDVLIYRACLFAAYLCTYRLSEGVWGGYFAPEKCVTEILNCMTDFARQMSPWKLTPDISLWLLYMAGGLTKVQYHKNQATVLVGRYRCFYSTGYDQDWELVEMRLKDYIWCEHMMKETLYRFWQQLLENPGIPLIFRIQTVSLKVLDLKFKVLDETI